MKVNVYTETEMTLVKHFTIEISESAVVNHFSLKANENWRDHIAEYVEDTFSEMEGIEQHYVKTIGGKESIHEVIHGDD